MGSVSYRWRPWRDLVTHAQNGAPAIKLFKLPSKASGVGLSNTRVARMSLALF
jgi:hypothetical protein